jgi:hypothetical protein
MCIDPRVFQAQSAAFILKIPDFAVFLGLKESQSANEEVTTVLGRVNKSTHQARHACRWLVDEASCGRAGFSCFFHDFTNCTVTPQQASGAPALVKLGSQVCGHSDDACLGITGFQQSNPGCPSQAQDRSLHTKLPG